MKFTQYFSFFALCTLFISCDKNKSNVASTNSNSYQDSRMDSTKKMALLRAEAIEKLAKDNTFIDIPVSDFYKYNFINGMPVSEANKIRAVLYRIMSHVKMVNNHYDFDAKSGKELGIREEVYEKFKEDFESSNKWIAEQQSKGHKPLLAPVNTKYLNTLLGKTN